ncbi:hypothetical protein C8R46DRAFT_470300 [Mycena filopes]|nr:hypothetical protein C8R46DRAFT_470300 [Mycena filopes]
MCVDEGFSFPLELEREIFETAALQHTNSIPALLRVCRRVFVWLEPLLYRVVVIPSDAAPILRPVQSKPATFLQRAVRYLFITPDMEDTLKIIIGCSNIVGLLIDGTLRPDVLDVLDHMAVRRLNFTLPAALSEWAPVTFTRPAFLFLTHLELYQGDDDDEPEVVTWSHFSPLASLPALTHLCFCQYISSDVLSNVAAECPQLVVIVTAWWEGMFFSADARSFAASLSFTDHRVVVMLVASYIEDWKLGALGGTDFWVRAENFPAMKRTGEITKTTFFLDC